MSNPCELNDCTPAEEISRWGCLKWIVFAALLGLGILLLLLQRCNGNTPAVTTTPEATATTAVVATVEAEPELDLVAPSLAIGGLAAGKALLSGVGMPDSIVRIFDGDTEIGQATVGADGNWSYEADASPNSRFRAVGELADGTAVGESSATALAIAGLTAAGFAATADSFNLSGTGEPGLDVNVRIDNATAASTTIDANGDWSVESGLPSLDVGEYVVSADMVDGDGDIYDTVSDAGLLSISAAAADLTTGDFVVDGNTFTWSGTGEPGATVNVMLNGEIVGTAIVDADGNWSFEGDASGLEPGEYDVSAEMVGADGTAFGESGVVTTLLISEPDAPLTTGDFDAADGAFTWSGTGQPGTTVDIYVNGELVGSVPVGDDGTWTYEGSYAGFEAGDYPLTARMVDGSGNTLDEAVEAALLSLSGADTGGGSASDATGLLRVLFSGSNAADGNDSDSGNSQDGGIVTGVAPAGSPGVALILDSSWSMTFGVDYTGIDIGPDTDESQRLTADDPNSRIAVAKGGLIDFVNEALPDGVPSALRVFGNLEGNLACQTDLMVPYGPLDKGQMVGTLQGVRPQFNANTALGASLDAIRTDLAEADAEQMTIVLVTDGDETCGGDPEAAIEALADAGFDVTVNIIGFAINDDELKAKLQRWAELGNGSYFDAADADSLVSSLRGAFAIPYRVLDADGAEVATGVTGGAAVELPVGDYTVELGTSPAATYEASITQDQTTFVITE